MHNPKKNIEPRQKATYFADENLFGYTHSIVYNETVKNNLRPVINTDVSALTKNLQSQQAMQIAAQSLEEDLDL